MVYWWPSPLRMTYIKFSIGLKKENILVFKILWCKEMITIVSMCTKTHLRYWIWSLIKCFHKSKTAVEISVPGKMYKNFQIAFYTVVRECPNQFLLKTVGACSSIQVRAGLSFLYDLFVSRSHQNCCILHNPKLWRNQNSFVSLFFPSNLL